MKRETNSEHPSSIISLISSPIIISPYQLSIYYSPLSALHLFLILFQSTGIVQEVEDAYEIKPRLTCCILEYMIRKVHGGSILFHAGEHCSTTRLIIGFSTSQVFITVKHL